MKLLASTIVALCATVALANPPATAPAAAATTTTTTTTTAPAAGHETATTAAPAGHEMAAHKEMKKAGKMAKMDCTKEENKTKDECKAAHK